MATRIQWLGHACLLLESDGRRVLIDPFLTGNPTAAARADEVSADLILISHGHEDHVGDAVAIARRTGATVLANYEISQWLMGPGGDRPAAMLPVPRHGMTGPVLASGLKPGERLGLTIEPAGGSPHPTTRTVLQIAL